MIPELSHHGHPHNRALLEELLVLLAEFGFEIELLYAAEVNVDELVEKILELLCGGRPPRRQRRLGIRRRRHS
jgi:hypothetical protein